MADGRVTLVGCGRLDSGDDAAGILVGKVLDRRALPQTRVVLNESPGVDLIADMNGAELFIVIDAASATPEHPPGSWERIDYHDFSGTLQTNRCVSSHALSIAEALELAKRIGELPPHVWIYALFGCRFDFGTEPSEQTTAMIQEVSDAVERDVTGFL